MGFYNGDTRLGSTPYTAWANGNLQEDGVGGGAADGNLVRGNIKGKEWGSG